MLAVRVTVNKSQASFMTAVDQRWVPSNGVFTVPDFNSGG